VIARWVFFEKGEPMVRRCGNYVRRQKKHRLDRGILIEYFARLGWNLADPAMWNSPQPGIYYREADRA
jgi:hypothetical protein